MAKAVFRSAELIMVSDKVMISTPAPYEDVEITAPREEDQEIHPIVEEYTGPTAEELRHEAEAFKAEWKLEKESMIEAAKAEANEIVQSADLSAARNKEQAAEEAASAKAQAQQEAEKIIAEAQGQAQQLADQIRGTLDDERKEALEKGREEGRTEGYAEGKAEVDRLIERTQTVLERAQDKRGEILTETERELIELVLLISRKIVKIISENQREVVVSNVLEALKKVRDRGNVIVRVNLADVKLATDHKKEFIQALEGAKSIQVMEDSSVDSGGCIIETDFGEIDARISSQLAELEARILEISPIKSRIKSRSG